MTDARGATTVIASGVAVAVHLSDKHRFSKTPQHSITLLQGLGVEGDAHCGATVQHRYDKKKDPLRPNLRQVHLLQTELLDEVNAKGFQVFPGNMGENISTRGLDLLSLPTGTRLHIGDEAVVELTGLRHPCVHIERFKPGLLGLMNDQRSDGTVLHKAGVMGIVIHGGVIYAKGRIDVQLPNGIYQSLQSI